MQLRTTSRRSGVVLLVVMALLAIFAALGLSFVFYAESEATASRLNSESLISDQPDIDPEVLLAHFLGEFIYGTRNPYSAMRGWDLATSIYGSNPASLNFVPFNGIGRTAISPAAAPNLVPFPTGNVDYYNIVNYQRFEAPAWSAGRTYNPGDAVMHAGMGYMCIATNLNQAPPNPAFWSPDPLLGSIRTPEFFGRQGDPNHRFVGGGNPPWTIQDTNSFYLARVSNPNTGTIDRQSFHRAWHNPGDAPNTPDLSTKAKYLRLRPHASWNPGFNPFITGFPFGLPDSDAGGDVRNFEDGTGATGGNNDSYFTDLGFPIMTAPNGKRYRPLFAPLVIDLNNRLHLWAHGNVNHFRPDPTGLGLIVQASSSQGYGSPDVNLALLTGGIGSTGNQPARTELLQFLNWRATTTPAGVASGLRQGAFYAPVDADGRNGALGTGALALPPTGSFWAFPTFPAGYDNLSAAEIASANTMLGFDPHLAPLHASHHEAILRHNGTNSPSLTSPAFLRMSSLLANRRVRGLVTSTSYGLDRVMTAPFIPFDPQASPNYVMSAAGFPMSTGVTPPSPAVPSVPPANSEYTADWRSTLGHRLRTNIKRPLTDYPAQNAMTGVIDVTVPATAALVVTAQTERQQLAKEIYDALIKVTGAQDPNLLPAGTPPPPPSFQATRWLAQLAVNMVDYMDSDDYVTPFKWYVDPANPATFEMVYGTELPRLVVSEAYASWDNDAADPEIMNPTMVGMPKATRSKVNVWLELHNPFADAATKPTGSPYPRDNGSAKLKLAGNPVYQVVIAKPSASPAMTNPANTTGDPNFGAMAPMTNVWGIASDWGNTAVTMEVLPGNGAASGPVGQNQGFYVVGPALGAPMGTTFVTGRDPGLAAQTTHTTPQMTISIADPALSPGATVTLALQRLANPHLPHDANPASALYNPFITVDYLDSIRLWDSRLYDQNGVKAPAPAGIAAQQALGRRQPYTAFNNPANAARSQVRVQTPAPALAGQPQHTFYSHNLPRDNPFNWLVHLDRPVVNAVELMHVSAHAPHQLTQKFRNLDTTGNLRTFLHTAPFQEQTNFYTAAHVQGALIYRALDLLGGPTAMAGSVPGGRWAGSVNLNTVNDAVVLQALLDANNGSTVYSRIVTARNGADPANSIRPQEGYPFRSFAAGNVNDTWLRRAGTTPMFQLTTTHPYLATSHLHKALNNITTTSNVFAVYWTVGFFEVVDESVRPARLGAEIGRSENRHIRHRFFAIVDRSAMQLYASRTTTAVTTPSPAAQPVTIDVAAINSMTGPATAWSNSRPYQNGDVVVSAGTAYYCIQPNFNTPPPSAAWAPALQPGMMFEVGAGPNTEVVAVQSVTGSNIMAVFTRPHAAGVPILCRGNPGPQPVYNPRRDNSVVLHMSVVK